MSSEDGGVDQEEDNQHKPSNKEGHAATATCGRWMPPVPDAMNRAPGRCVFVDRFHLHRPARHPAVEARQYHAPVIEARLVALLDRTAAKASDAGPIRGPRVRSDSVRSRLPEASTV